MNDQLAHLEIRLLLLKYGRQRVLRALAQLSDQTQEEIEQQLRTMEQKRQKKRHKPTALELAASESQGREEIAGHLRALAVAFQNRVFLPHLRDVQRFLDRVAPQGKLKSRESAAPALIRTLAKLPKEELVRLSANDESRGENDYALLARAIMGTPTAQERAAHRSGEGSTKG